MQGLGYDFEADIWSAGVLLFSMLSGLSIFEGESDEQICHSVAHQPIDLESEPWPFVSQGAKDLLARSSLPWQYHKPFHRNASRFRSTETTGRHALNFEW